MKIKLVSLIIPVILLNACVATCNKEELCDYSTFYDGASFREQERKFKQLSNEDKVGVYIYGMLYQHPEPYVSIRLLSESSPDILPELIEMSVRHGKPNIREYSVRICEKIIKKNPNVTLNAKLYKKVKVFIFESKEIVWKHKEKIYGDKYPELVPER